MPHKISLSLDEPDEAQATVYGIISDLPDYRLVFMINEGLGLRLKRKSEDRKRYHKAGVVTFAEFEYHEKLRIIDWHLTANSGGMVLPEEEDTPVRSALPLVESLRSINYFLWYPDGVNAELDRHIFEILKPNPYIRVLQRVDVSATRHIDNLISEY